MVCQYLVRISAVILLLALLASGACRPLVEELRGPPFPEDPTTATLRALRANESGEKTFGFSQKAREIERDLGFK